MSDRETRPLRIAMVGTRGVPAAYSGFETAVEEIGQRLVAQGHTVTVYCRIGKVEKLKSFLGMKLVYLPAVKSKTMETLSHTALSVLHMLFTKRHDVAFVFNAANSPLVPVIRAKGTAVAVHVDGLEWKRDKWSNTGKRYYRIAEELAVRHADALIADAAGIADYYDHEFDIDTELLSYGSKVIREPASDRLAELGLETGKYHLVVARFEPENHVDVIVDGYTKSDAELPLIVVGSAPYSAAYTERIAAVAASDDRIRMLGGVWDQEQLNQLYANALTYSHGHSVGGTNPSLLRAMGAAAAVLAWDVVFNREVLGDDGKFFAGPDELAALVVAAEADAEGARESGERLRDRAEQYYDWDAVSAGYEELAKRLAGGYSTHGVSRGKRNPVPWVVPTGYSAKTGNRRAAVQDVVGTADAASAPIGEAQ